MVSKTGDSKRRPMIDTALYKAMAAVFCFGLSESECADSTVPQMHNLGYPGNLVWYFTSEDELLLQAVW